MGPGIPGLYVPLKIKCTTFLYLSYPLKSHEEIFMSTKSKDNVTRRPTGKREWEFTVIMEKRASVAIHSSDHALMSLGHLVIPVVVNETFEYRALVITHSGVCPFQLWTELLKSEIYGRVFSRKVASLLKPYYHGKMDITYLTLVGQTESTLQTPFQPQQQYSQPQRSFQPPQPDQIGAYRGIQTSFEDMMFGAQGVREHEHLFFRPPHPTYGQRPGRDTQRPWEGSGFTDPDKDVPE